MRGRTQPTPPTLSTGVSLPNPFRSNIEAAFNRDFSDVRVYHDHGATMMDAVAFTTGTEIHIAPGHYQPNSPEGQQLLAHELTHVVQQRSGGVSDTPVAENLVEASSSVAGTGGSGGE